MRSCRATWSALLDLRAIAGQGPHLHVDLEVRNDALGFLFGDRGDFASEWMPAGEQAPAHVLPRRHERRT